MIEDVALPLILAVLIPLLAYRIKAFDKGGAIVSGVMIFSIVSAIGVLWFLPAFVGFLISAFATKFEYKHKKRLGLAESKRGRKWMNVAANGLVPMLSAIAYGYTGNVLFLVAYLGAVSAAVSDTLSAEIGSLSGGRPWLITTFKRVKRGTDGGVSAVGTFAGLVAGAVVSFIPFLLGVAPLAFFYVGTLAGFAGNIGDSFVGALFERKGLVNKHQTNLACTLIGALMGWILVL